MGGRADPPPTLETPPSDPGKSRSGLVQGTGPTSGGGGAGSAAADAEVLLLATSYL